MKTPFRLIATAVSLAVLTSGFPAHAGGKVPCEPLVPKVAAAMMTSSASDADKAKAKALQATGLVKCKAEKDADAVADFKAALKLLGVAP